MKNNKIRRMLIPLLLIILLTSMMAFGAPAPIGPDYDDLVLEYGNDGLTIKSSGIGHLHLSADVISGMTEVTSADADYMLVWDATDSSLKKCDMGEVRGAGNGYTNLTEFVDQTAWRLFYSNNLGDVIELALGTDGQYLKSTGVASAPIFDTPTGAGDMLKATYDTDADGDIDVAAGGTEKSLWTLYCIPYLSGTTAFGEIPIGTAEYALTVNATATGYDFTLFDLSLYYLKTEIDTLGKLEAIYTKDIIDSDELAALKFTDLTDTPANYTGSSLKFARVNVGETALEFAAEADPTVDTDAKIKAILVDEVTKTGTFTAGKIAKINNATGIIEMGTNTDTEVSDAVTKKHTAGADTTLGTLTADVNMGTHKLTGLSVPSASGQSVRTTATITEANLEDAVSKKHTQNTDTGAGGEWDFGAHSAGFTLQTDTGTGAKTIDWRLSNKFKFTFGAGNVTFTFTAPTNPCTLMLTIIQDTTGSRTITWPATVKWPGGVAPTLTTTANARDKVALDWDGTQYDGMCSKDFK